jgi:hypothetical protein
MNVNSPFTPLLVNMKCKTDFSIEVWSFFITDKNRYNVNVLS